jgi:hypothetical protein
MSLYQQIGLKAKDISNEILDECIIIKSLKDFNNAKFAKEDRVMLEKLIYDVFIEHRSDTSQSQSDQSDYGNLKEMIQQKMFDSKLDHNLALEHKCYELYEISQVKTGCIIIGEA